MTIEFIDRIDALSASDWDALRSDHYPFTRHAFLAALEASGSVGAGSGWQPQHLVWRHPNGQLRAAMPLYLKTHSYGEYVFDWAWANAYAQHGLDYYPKLLGAIPFTPCQGPRLLTRENPATLADAIAQALRDRCRQLGASGWHCLFPQEPTRSALAQAGSLVRTGCQFHWHNRDYRDFDDFLASMSSRKRKNIRRERRQVREQGFEFEWRRGDEIRHEDWQLFFGLYQLTYLKRSGSGGYLNDAFFHQLSQRMPEQTLMVLARKGGTTIAAALFFHDSHTLYGRYWGCRAEHEFLHFETCYYQGLDYAISVGLRRFDGGAQGEHKVARGFEPTLTYSNHWLAEPAFHQAVGEFVNAERQDLLAYADAAKAHLPFKQDNPPVDAPPDLP